jgi:hypothetical protein
MSDQDERQYRAGIGEGGSLKDFAFQFHWQVKSLGFKSRCAHSDSS